MSLILDDILGIDVKALDIELTSRNVTFVSSMRRDEKQKLLIQRVLGNGSTPAPVESEEIQILKLQMKKDELDREREKKQQRQYEREKEERESREEDREKERDHERQVELKRFEMKYEKEIARMNYETTRLQV